MLYNIINTFQINEMSVLREMVGQKLNFLSTDKPIQSAEYNGQVSYVVFNVGEQNKLYILNSEFVQMSDSDEYSKFFIRQISKEDMKIARYRYWEMINGKKVEIPFKWYESALSQQIDSIEIVRDQAEWSYNNSVWKVTTDVALKLKTQKNKIVFVLQDSLSCFISMYYNYLCDDNELVERQWSNRSWGIKSELTHLERKVIKL